MKTNFDEDMKVPYVSEELCKYLREIYSLSTVLRGLDDVNSGDMALGIMLGISTVLERLEAIHVQQEADNGIY